MTRITRAIQKNLDVKIQEQSALGTRASRNRNRTTKNKIMKKTSMVKVFGLALLLTAQTVFGLSSYVSRIPNGSVNGCINCHGASGPPLNSFGNDFLDNAKSYTGLGSIDSDGDGYTNDQELNATPPTLPGNASSKPTATVTAPSITTQPASQTVTAGANVSFSVVATGTAPLSYQWMKNGANITGASSSTLALTAVTSATPAATRSESATRPVQLPARRRFSRSMPRSLRRSSRRSLPARRLPRGPTSASQWSRPAPRR